jgi:L-ribulokinase
VAALNFDRKKGRIMGNRKREYVLGLDYGTLSVRAVLIDASTGAQAATSVANYRDGVIDQSLPGDSKRLPPETALQNPQDYLDSLRKVVPQVLKRAGVSGDAVQGIGVDFTSCTMLPTRRDGTPLCQLKAHAKNPHAWVKLWKHHSAQAEADAINAAARTLNPTIVRTYGGSYSSEWFFSKVLETARKAPRVYDAAERFIEAGDWLVWQLTGCESRNVSAAGFKAMRVIPDGKGGWEYPSIEFFERLHPKLRDVAAKVDGPIVQLGACAGGLADSMARKLGLRPGIAVAAANIDAHAGVPACGVTGSGELVMIMGTSTCHLLIADEPCEAEGICGVVQDGIVPGKWGYEAGQPGVGDLFAWFVDKCLQGKTSHETLEKSAAGLAPGANGLIALDWWNGNRSVLSNSKLSGLLVGLTLSTTPAEIYRALLEATAFGTRKIIEAFEKAGIPIERLVACGGLAQKSPLLLQIYADVTGRPLRVPPVEQASALGAAMHGAVAAGIHPNIATAARKMSPGKGRTFRPVARNQKVYQELYEQYSRLHDTFGRGEMDTMVSLKELRNKTLGFA